VVERAEFALRSRNPDVLTCIANLSNDEVITPPELANKMLDVLAEAWAADHDGANIWHLDVRPVPLSPLLASFSDLFLGRPLGLGRRLFVPHASSFFSPSAVSARVGLIGKVMSSPQ
jgi:hypothetical protein